MAIVSGSNQAIAQQQTQPQSQPQEQTQPRNANTYDYFGTPYDLNALKRKTWEGVNEYINKLPKGQKFKTDIENNIRKIFNGLSDGTITFDSDSNQFIDTRQGLVNLAKNDTVGWAAYHIFSNMGKDEDKYQDPVSKYKIKFDGQASIDNAIKMLLYNSDQEQINPFIDRDSYDKKAKKRSLKNRAKYVYDTLLPLTTREGWDKTFTDFSQEDFDRFYPIVQRAIQVISDGSMDAGDLAELTKLSSTLSWSRMFHTGDGYGDDTASNTTEQKAGEQVASTTSTSSTAGNATTATTTATSTGTAPVSVESFEAWMKRKYPKYSKVIKNAVSLKSSKSYGSWTDKALQDALSTLSNDELKTAFAGYLVNANWSLTSVKKIQDYFKKRGVTLSNNAFDKQYALTSILRAMHRKSLLTPIGGSYNGFFHVPGLDKDNTGIMWDSKGNSIRRVPLHIFPYWQKKVMDEYTRETGNNNTAELQKYFTKKAKEGGVLKAENGLGFNPPSSTMDDINLRNLLSWARINYGNTNRTDLKYSGQSKDFMDAYLPGWTPEQSRSLRDTNIIGNPTPTIRNAFNSHLEYVNSGKMVDDVRNAYTNWKNKNQQGTDEQFVKYYNDKVQALRDKSLTKFTGKYMDTGWTQFFDDFNELYNSRSANYGNPSTIGAQGNIKDIYGSAMFLRNPLAFDNDSDFSGLRKGTFGGGSSNAFWINNEGKLELRQDFMQPTAPETDVIGSLVAAPGQAPQGSTRTRTYTDALSGETRFGPSDGGKKKDNKFDLGAIGRDLSNSIKKNPLMYDVADWMTRHIANIKNEKQLLRDPMTVDPQNRQSPEHWNYYQRKLNNKEGTEMINNVSTPITPNADMAARQKLDAYRAYVKNYKNPGDIADHETGIKSLLQQIADNNFSADSRHKAAMENRKHFWDVKNYNDTVHATARVNQVENLAQLLQKFGMEQRAEEAQQQARRQTAIDSVLQGRYQNAVNAYKTGYKELHPNATESDMLADNDFVDTISKLIEQYGYDSYNYDYSSNKNPYEDFKPRTYGEIINEALGKAKQGGILVPKNKRFKGLK